MPARWGAALALTTWVGLAAPDARADDVEPPPVPAPTRAEVLFADALRAQDEGRHAEACDAFRASAEATESVGALLNVAHCSVREGAYERARSEYQRVLVLNEETADPVRKQRVREAAERGIGDVSSRFGSLEVVLAPAGVAATISIGGGAQVKAGERVSLETGAYVVEVTAPGYERALRAARVRGREVETVSVELTPVAVAPAPRSGAPIAAAVMLSGGAASAVLGGVLVALASDRAAMIREECGPDVAPPSCPLGDPARADELASEGIALEASGIALLALGGAALGTGVVLFAVGDEPEALAVNAGLSTREAGLWLVGSF